MKVKYFLYSLLLFVVYGFVIPAGLPVDLAKADLAGKIRIQVVADDITARQKILDNLKSELGSLETKFKEFSEKVQRKTQDIKEQISILKRDAGHGRSSEITTKKIEKLNKLNQLLFDIKEAKKQVLEVVKQHIDFWEKYFNNRAKSNEPIDDKSIYTYTDLQKIAKKIALEEEQRVLLLAKKEEANSSVSRQEHVVTTKDRDIRQIEKEIDDLRKQQAESHDFKNEVGLFDFEKDIAHKERDLAETRIELYQKNEDLYDSKILIIQETLKMLREDMLTIRNRIHIDKAEVGLYEQKSNDIRRDLSAQKMRLTDQRNKILAERSSAQEKLDVLSNRYNISLSDMRQIQDWEIDAGTIPEMYAYYAVSLEQTKICLADRLLQKIKAEIAIDDAKIERAQILYDTVKLLYGITQGLFTDSNYLEKEKALLKELKLTITTETKKDCNEISVAHNVIKDQYKSVANVKKQQEKIKSLATKAAIINQRKLEESSQLLSLAIQKLEAQKDVSLQISELYTKLTEIKEETIENISFMLQELDLIGVWHRAIHAVTWEGVRNIIPNIKLFIQSVYVIVSTYIYHLKWSDSMHKINSYSFLELFSFCLVLLGLFLLFLFLKYLLPLIYKTLMFADIENHSLYIFNRYIAIILSFCIVTFNQLYLLFVFLIFSAWYQFSVTVMLFFWAYSIIFWIYALRIFIQQCIIINRRSDYVLFNKRFVEKFNFVASFFFISTVVILCFRKMFMLVMTYQQSEFPNILLRIYHIVIFISIVISIDKETILDMIPTKTKIGQRLFLVVQKYYYVLLVCILGLLIMSDPYLGGYGSLMWYFFWTTLFTAFILVFLFFFHKFIGRYSEVLFFQNDDSSQGRIERFENAKTWYGLYVLTLFVLFVLLAAIICSHLWGYDFTFRSIKTLLHYKLPWTIVSWGKPVSLEIIDILRMIFSVTIGFLSSYVCRKFVLDKVFEIHYVDPGVQNTITIISRYVIIFISFLIGFAQAGLGDLVSYILGFGAFALAWAFKDLFTDFFAYFFILVQRPLKLGDYVKIDDNIIGVVRKISPRTVILRRKNAVNIVVPNSTVLKASLYNWNYTRSYIGFNDILFVVPFGTDIGLVRDVLFKILDDDTDVLKMPQPIVRLEDFSDKGYVFMVRGFLSSGNTLRQWDIASNIRFAIVTKLAEKGIQIAAPTLGVVWQNNSAKNINIKTDDISSKEG